MSPVKRFSSKQRTFCLMVTAPSSFISPTQGTKLQGLSLRVLMNGHAKNFKSFPNWKHFNLECFRCPSHL